MEINRIYNEDCLDTMCRMPDNFIDVTITSCPYDNNRKYNGYFFDFENIAKELYRTTKVGGVVVWVINDMTINGSESLTSCKQKIYFREECGFNIHDTMIYMKPNFSNPSSNRYHQVMEYMFIFSKGKPKTFNPIMDRKNKYGVCWGKNTSRQVDGTMKERDKNIPREYGMRHNVWLLNTVGQENPCKVQNHPAKFPKSLAKGHIISWSNLNDIIFDPMVGSGTTCIEAKKIKRNYIGSEISKEYCKMAEEGLDSVVV